MGEESNVIVKLLVIIIVFCMIFAFKVMYKNKRSQVKPVEPTNTIIELTNEV